MATKIGINGFGRIGRVVLRRLIASGKLGKEFQISKINDLTSPQTLAHLLKYDSVHGVLQENITATDNEIRVGDQKIEVSAERDPSKLAWSDSNTSVVLECTGIFRKREQAALHISAGAKKVIISAPSPDPDITIAMGVNHQSYDGSKHHVISCASCTTNCLAPVAKVLLDSFGIKRGTMTTIHSYTNDQQLLDLPHSDLRRARAAAMSMIPTTTGAAAAVGLVIPELKGKVDGFAVRVPTPNGSLVDFVCETEKDVSVDSVNKALKDAADGSLKGILGYSDEPLVSTDYIGNTNSSIVDALSTMVIGGNMVKVIAWYDNEVGFSSRMIDACEMVSSAQG